MRSTASGPALLPLLALTFSAGCVFHVPATYETTDAGRLASFAPFATLQIGEEPVGQVLDRQTAWLLANRTIDFEYRWAAPWRFTTRAIDPERPGGTGLAVPLTHDGYLLTAAHNISLGGSPLYVLPAEVQWLLKHPEALGRHAPYFAMFMPRLVEQSRVRARIVWHSGWEPDDPDNPHQMNPSDQLDLAVLHAPLELAEPAGWANVAGFEPGMPLLAGTPPFSSPIAGCFLAIAYRQPQHPEVAATYFAHTAPTRPGDSGGPVLLTDGRLVGIQVASAENALQSYLLFSLRHERSAIAIAPDPAHLMTLIDADRSRHAD